MAEEDFFDRTEPPSQRKLAEAKKKGIVAKSRDMSVAVSFLAVALSFFFLSNTLYHWMIALVVDLWNNLNLSYDDVSTVTMGLRLGSIKIAMMLGGPLVMLMVVLILSQLFQVGLIFSLERLKPRWSNINFFYSLNYGKFFSIQSLVLACFGQVKILLVIYVSWKFINSEIFTISSLMQRDANFILRYIFERGLLLFFYLSMSFLLLAVLDLAYQNWQFRQDLMMSPREVREERKQAEGNIHWKEKIQDLARQWSENRLLIAIPKADVIVTDRQTCAIALKYDSHRMPAPMCIARGGQQKAVMITTMAKRFRIPVVENALLAHSLFEEIKEGSAVPPQFYYSVANVFTDVKKR